jgi:Patatin-like phospholipase
MRMSGALEVHMGLKVVPGRSRSRVGLVLGAGGVLGAAWMTGALPALQERLPRPLGDLDLIVGTSAGSVVAAALRCGVGIDEMVAHQRGEAVGPLEAACWPVPGCRWAGRTTPRSATWCTPCTVMPMASR